MLKVIFWLSFLATIFVVTVASSCPEGSIKWESKCFLFVTEPSKFFIADGDCVNRGGHLASIHDRSTNVFLAQEAPRYITGINVTDFWIGATNIMTANFTWSWMDETPFNFSEWRDFVPPNTQSCGVLNYANGIWIPDYCYRLKPYVCGFDALQRLTTTTTTESPTTKTTTDYTTSTKTKSTPSSTTGLPTVTSTFQPSFPSTQDSTTIPPLTWSPTPSRIPLTDQPSTATSLPTIFPTRPSTNPPSTEGFTTTPTSTTPSHAPTDLTTKTSFIPSSFPTMSPQNPSTIAIPSTTNAPQTETTANPSSVPTEFPTIVPSTSQPSTTTLKPSEIPTIPTQTPFITTNVPSVLSTTTVEPTPQTIFPSTNLPSTVLPPITTNVPLTEPSTIPSVIPTRLSTTAPPTTSPSTDSPKPSEIPTISTQVPPKTTSAPQTASSAIPLTIPTTGPSTNPPSTTTPKPSEIPTLPTQVPPLTVNPATSAPSPQPSSTSQSPSPSTTTFGPDTYCGASNIFKNAEGKATCWFYTPQLDWDSAEKFCKDRRAHLASLHDDGDIHIASNLDQKDYTNTFIWIGFHSTDNLTTWEWTDGTTVDYAPWDKDLNRFSACAHLFENTFHSDFYCSDVTIGVCKKEMFID